VSLEQPVAGDNSEKPQKETRVFSTNEAFKIDSPIPETAQPRAEMSAENRERALMLRFHERLEQGGYLTKPEPPSDNRLVRFAESTFRPEVFKVGKTSVSCSIVTAIKRKNPLCLLNPFVLSISW